MALYAIGDVQGCYDSLRRLLDLLRFDPASDRLWFTGDLVNRGPHSAAVLRFVAGLGDRAVSVLGNHDLHLLARAVGAGATKPGDTFLDVLEASDSEYLLTWLASRPLFHYDADVGCALVHAGVLPQWDLIETRAAANEVAPLIARRDSRFLQQMYGDEPDRWEPALSGARRHRLIVNAFTRLRYCTPGGRADFSHKGPPGSQPASLVPWFLVPGRRTAGVPIIFGHWSTLGRFEGHNVIGLDTGCCWGGRLTARRLLGGPGEFISVDCAAAGR